jgi:hypothetical protein
VCVERCRPDVADACIQTEGPPRRRHSDETRDSVEVTAAQKKATQLEAIHTRAMKIAADRRQGDEEVLCVPWPACIPTRTHTLLPGFLVWACVALLPLAECCRVRYLTSHH